MYDIHKKYALGSRGFTLIELLVVIAIIGILATVVLAGLGSQRDKARETRALGSARSAVPVATICTDALSTLNTPAPADGSDGDLVCTSAAAAPDPWPSIVNQGWRYEIINNGASGAAWSFRVCKEAVGTACGTGDMQYVCNISGCTGPTAM